ncbi:MAG: choice-of-anchor Q domain-containing protein, partial [Anaerolineae bacterium]
VVAHVGDSRAVLGTSSNAINHGITLAWVTRDIDGDPRPIGPAPDVGADEYVRARIYLPLVLRNF